MLIWLVLAALIALGVMAGALWVLSRQRTCPACDTGLEVVSGSEPLHAYEVLTCPACATPVTLSGGQRIRFSWCPQCHQRALDLAVERDAHTIEVAEHCQLCGYRGTRQVGVDPPPRGIVVPFPDRTA